MPRSMRTFCPSLRSPCDTFAFFARINTLGCVSYVDNSQQLVGFCWNEIKKRPSLMARASCLFCCVCADQMSLRADELKFTYAKIILIRARDWNFHNVCAAPGSNCTNLLYFDLSLGCPWDNAKKARLVDFNCGRNCIVFAADKR